MDTISFGDLPVEVQEIIGPFLRPHDLSICVCVCRPWRTIFNTFLWRHVEKPPRNTWKYGDSNWNDIFLRCAAGGALRRNDHLVRSIKLECDEEFLETFLQFAPPNFSQLISAELVGYMNKDAIIADIIRRSSAGWRSLVFEQDDFGDYEQYVHFGPNSVEALLEHAPALEVFRVNGAPDIKSKDIQRLLCSPAKLKELYLLSPFRRDNDDENCSLNAYDAVKSDWVCTSLKVFGCQVGEIPRPDITHTIAGESPIYYVVKGTKQESMDLQRRVCAQFARLQHLDELMLGVPFNSDYDSYRRHDKECGQRYDCLAMSLESGLGLMKGLKNLRLVGLEDMEVGMCNDK